MAVGAGDDVVGPVGGGDPLGRPLEVLAPEVALIVLGPSRLGDELLHGGVGAVRELRAGDEVVVVLHDAVASQPGTVAVDHGVQGALHPPDACAAHEERVPDEGPTARHIPRLGGELGCEVARCRGLVVGGAQRGGDHDVVGEVGDVLGRRVRAHVEAQPQARHLERDPAQALGEDGVVDLPDELGQEGHAPGG